MGTNQRRVRRGDWGPAWLAWWLMWAFILFWPMLVSPVLEGIWLALFAACWYALLRQRARYPGPRARP